MPIRNRKFRIKRNHGCESPSAIVAISVEAEIFNGDSEIPNQAMYHQFRSCHCIGIRKNAKGWYGRTEQTFKDTEPFWQWIRERARPREPIYLIAYDWHRVAQLLGFWQELDNGNFTTYLPVRQFIDNDGNPREIPEWRGMLAIDDRPFVVFAVSPKGTIKLVDLKNYLDIPLADIAESVGKPLVKVLQCADTEELICQRLQNECDIILTTVCRLMDSWKDGDRGNWHPTAARLAYSNFTHEFMSDDGLIIDNDVMDRKFQREAYYGGEVQNWYRGYVDGPIIKVDCIGLYPACMLYGSFPTRVIDTAKYGSWNSGLLPSNPSCCTAAILVNSNGELPVRLEGGQVNYPTGTFQTVLCGDELQWAVENDRVKEVYAWQLYECNPIFSRYVSYWWSIRKQAKAVQDKATDYLAKIMLNSLYGKFAARRPTWTVVPQFKPPIRWGYFAAPDKNNTGFKKYRAIAGVCQEFTGDEEREDTFPAISAFVAAAGRIRMRTIRQCLPERSYFAQQTDALLLSDAGYESLAASPFMRSDELGMMRVVEFFMWAEFWGGNHYETSEGLVMAGLAERNERISHNRWKQWICGKSSDVVRRGPTTKIDVSQKDFVLIAGKNGKQYGPDGWVTCSTY